MSSFGHGSGLPTRPVAFCSRAPEPSRCERASWTKAHLSRKTQEWEAIFAALPTGEQHTVIIALAALVLLLLFGSVRRTQRSVAKQRLRNARAEQREKAEAWGTAQGGGHWPPRVRVVVPQAVGDFVGGVECQAATAHHLSELLIV